jgi:hypothetical protein
VDTCPTVGSQRDFKSILSKKTVAKPELIEFFFNLLYCAPGYNSTFDEIFIQSRTSVKIGKIQLSLTVRFQRLFIRLG